MLLACIVEILFTDGFISLKMKIGVDYYCEVYDMRIMFSWGIIFCMLLTTLPLASTDTNVDTCPAANYTYERAMLVTTTSDRSFLRDMYAIIDDTTTLVLWVYVVYHAAPLLYKDAQKWYGPPITCLLMWRLWYDVPKLWQLIKLSAFYEEYESIPILSISRTIENLS